MFYKQHVVDIQHFDIAQKVLIKAKRLFESMLKAADFSPKEL